MLYLTYLADYNLTSLTTEIDESDLNTSEDDSTTSEMVKRSRFDALSVLGVVPAWVWDVSNSPPDHAHTYLGST